MVIRQGGLTPSPFSSSSMAACDSQYSKIVAVRRRIEVAWSVNNVSWARKREVVTRLGSILSRLVNNIFIEPKMLNSVLRESNAAFCAHHFHRTWHRANTSKRIPLEQKFWADLKASTVEGRKRELTARLGCHAVFRCESDLLNPWAMVFDTLTVDPEREDEVFSVGSNVWHNYIIGLKRHFASLLYGNRRAAPKGEVLLDYFCVTEEGTENGKLHLHVVYFIDPRLIRFFRDPNRSRLTPNWCEIDEIAGRWEYGHSTPTAVRYTSPAPDAFTKAGWIWPSKRNKATGKYSSIESGTYGRVIGYISKYINKSYTDKRGRQWRTRMTRGLGEAQVEKLINQLSLSECRKLAQGTTFYELLGQNLKSKLLPVKLIRHVAITRYLQSLKKRWGERYSIIYSEERLSLRPPSCYDRLLGSIHATGTMFMSQSIMDSNLRKLTVTAISRIRALLLEVFGTTSVPTSFPRGTVTPGY